MELIPESLRRVHEDGETVFFCGAGVSMPAGLPSFKRLTRDILTDMLPLKNGCEPGSTEALSWQAFEGGRYDEALGILESPHEGFDPKNVRERVRHYLSTPTIRTLDKHRTLARLANLDTERGRLVTTNFDEWGIHFIQVHPMGCGLAAPEQECEIARIVRVAAKPTHTRIHCGGSLRAATPRIGRATQPHAAPEQ